MNFETSTIRDHNGVRVVKANSAHNLQACVTPAILCDHPEKHQQLTPETVETVGLQSKCNIGSYGARRRLPAAHQLMAYISETLFGSRLV